MTRKQDEMYDHQDEDEEYGEEDEDKGGIDKEDKDGKGKRSSGATATLHGSYNHDVNNIRGRQEQGTQDDVVFNYRQGLKKWDGRKEYEVMKMNFGTGAPTIPGQGRDDGNGYDGEGEKDEHAEEDEKDYDCDFYVWVLHVSK